MPENTLQVLQLRPGVNREGTSYSGEGGWYDCDKIRFRSGLPEKLGGWMWYGEGSYIGVCRHLTEWASLSNFLLIGVGTSSLYYILSGGKYYDITPLTRTDSLTTNPLYSMYNTLADSISDTLDVIPITSVTAGNFDLIAPLVVQIGSELIYVPVVDTVVNTLGTAAAGCTRGYLGTTAATHTSGDAVSSSWLVVKDTSNDSSAGSVVNISGAVNLLATQSSNILVTQGGTRLATQQDVIFDVYTASDINGEHIITAANATYIAFDTGVYSTASAQGGGSGMTAAYSFSAGLYYQGVQQGWGAGPWNGDREWNQAFVSTNPKYELRLWSAQNFGQDLYFNPRDSGIFHWDAATNLNSVGQVTGRGVDITSTTFSNVTLDQIVVGNYYQIRNIGSTTQAQWNILAGTTNSVYVAGNFSAGTTYTIITIGTTDFTAIGAASNTPGLSFVATGAGSGTGTASASSVYAVGDKFFCADVIASGYGTGVVFDPGIPSVATCIISTDERHIVAFGCNDAVTEVTNGTPVQQDLMFIAWCAQEQPQVWWPTQTNTAGSYRLTIGSKIITAAQTRQETLVFTDMAVYSMQYLGAPYVFGFNLIDQNSTIASPNAYATANNITYWMGQDKFYAYSGRVDTLPCALRQYIFDDINTSQLDQVYAGTNEKYNEVWWFYPSKDALINDRYVVYNHLEKLWYFGQLSRTAWLDSYALGYPLGAVPNLDDPLQPTGISVEHEVGADDGSVNPIQPISAYIQSSDFDIGQGGYQFSFVKRIIPDMDFIGSTVSNPSAMMTLTARNYPGIGVNTDPMQTTTSDVNGTKVDVQVYDYTEQVWIRIRGRQLQFRVESSDLGVKWQLGAPRLQLQVDGRR